VIAQLVDQVLLGVVRICGRVLLGVRLRVLRRRDVDRVVLRIDRDGLDLPVVDLREEARVVGRMRVRARTDELLREEGEHDHNEDREGCAFEETTHGLCVLVGADPWAISARGQA
jgi:hypothetical protein